MFLRFLALIGVALLAGCGGPPPLASGSSLAVAKVASLPPPSASDQIGVSRSFLIGPQDRLAIDVWGIPDLSRQVQVDPNGQIAFPIAGTITAAGKTTAEISQLLSTGLKRYVREPMVTVSMLEAVSRTLTVDGEVEKPGNYPVISNMTLMRAIASAQGEADLANSKEVVIFRTVDNQRMAALYDLGAIQRGVYEDPTVYPNDVIVVGESGRKRLVQNAIAVGPALLTPLIYILTR